MNQKIQNLKVRTISAIVFAAIVILMTDLSRETFVILWTAMAVMSLGEFYILIFKHGGKLKKKNLWVVFGTIYIIQAYLLLMFYFKGIFQQGTDDSQRMFVIMLVTLIWANDVGAYLVGISIGKHKMMPKISPKKSWEGFFGGIIFTVGTAILWKILCWDKIMQETWKTDADFEFFIILGTAAALASVGGDMLESKFKRILGIKDSGKFLPGHGGVLDRMDSLMMTAPVAALCVYIYYFVL